MATGRDYKYLALLIATILLLVYAVSTVLYLLSPPSIWVAAGLDDVLGVKYYLEQGVSVNEKTEYLMGTPLCIAAQSGAINTAAYLMQNGAEVDSERTDGKTPLLLASEHGHVEIVRLLLEEGANINQQDNVGRTALHFAAMNNHTAVIQALLDAGIDTALEDNAGASAYDYAVALDNPDARKLLNEGR
jgi:ankyrin repeat protein